MAEDFCVFSKDQIIIKPPKKSLVATRMVLLLFATVFGIYIFSICLKQIGTPINPNYVDHNYSEVPLVRRPCHTSFIPPGEDSYVHFPKPLTYSRNECSCHPVRFFAILSTQRSGSGWFETLLNSHINVSSNGEIFSAKERRSNATTIVETLDEVYNLDWYSSASKNECSAAVGFKWMLNQGLMAYHKEIVEYFNRRDVSAIFLFRRNHLRRLVSVLANSFDRSAKLLNGTHKSHVHSPSEAEVLAKYKPKINTTVLLEDLKNLEEWRAKALDYFNSTRHIILYYEDLINNQTKLVDILNFLKLPQRKLESRQVKIHTKPLSAQVDNWDDVYKTLNGTQYEIFLHSDYHF
ncbi:uncharacterized protein [Aristolochia californica]|uniref:uncharacterized protein n=1 Tax=Aristolochia californica TaxID=171875 RepID=UPI0035DBEB52